MNESINEDAESQHDGTHPEGGRRGGIPQGRREGRVQEEAEGSGARDCAPEVAKVEIRWKVPVKIHWGISSGNPLEE